MKTTEEKNRMIAEFMDIKVPLTHGDDIENSAVENGDELFYIHELEYHISWDWLMPVVEKINSELKGVMNVLIMSNACRIYADDNSFNHSEEQDSTIQATYQAVVKFIEWYNKQK